jgi:uracil permease
MENRRLGPLGGAELNFGNFAIGGIGLAALVGMLLNLIIPKREKA